MNGIGEISTNIAEAPEPGSYGNSSPSRHDQSPAADDSYRLTELEVENARLHRLVAELLIKNQQLRKQVQA